MKKYFKKKSFLLVTAIFFIVILTGSNAFADSQEPSYSILKSLKDNGITLVVILTALLVFLKEFWEEIGSNSITSHKLNSPFYLMIGLIIFFITLFIILPPFNATSTSTFIYSMIQVILILIILMHPYATYIGDYNIELKKLSDEESGNKETSNKNFSIEINNKNSKKQKKQKTPINGCFYFIISIVNIFLSSKYILDSSTNSVDFLMKSVFLLFFILAIIMMYKYTQIADNLKLYSIKRDKDSIHAIILSDEEDFFYIRQLNYNTKEFDKTSYIRKSDIKKLEVEDNVEFVFYRTRLRYTIRNYIIDRYNKVLSYFSKNNIKIAIRILSPKEKINKQLIFYSPISLIFPTFDIIRYYSIFLVIY